MLLVFATTLHIKNYLGHPLVLGHSSTHLNLTELMQMLGWNNALFSN